MKLETLQQLNGLLLELDCLKQAACGGLPRPELHEQWIGELVERLYDLVEILSGEPAGSGN